MTAVEVIKVIVGAGRLCCVLLVWALTTGAALAQGGPPMRTDDPGTPGNGNFEVNVALTANRSGDERELETPLLDINYGLGERIQLKYEVPWVIRKANGPAINGLGNSMVGVKWRFFENKKREFAISTYPQLEMENPTNSGLRGVVETGTKFLLPLEVSTKMGPVDVNGELGFTFVPSATNEWLAGLVFGREVSKRLQLLAEVYGAGETSGTEHERTFDFGGRFKIRESVVLLFMAGKGLRKRDPGFVGYFGLQFLLSRKQSASP